MPKENLLDRLAGAMKTLGKREGKALTPRQRVAAAQRWNSLADIGEGELDRLYRISESGAAPSVREYDEAERRVANIGTIEPEGNRADNPFRFDWMGEPQQYESRLKNYKPLTDTQYERLLEIEDEARQRDLDAIHQEWYDNFIEPWRH